MKSESQCGEGSHPNQLAEAMLEAGNCRANRDWSILHALQKEVKSSTVHESHACVRCLELLGLDTSDMAPEL